MHAFAGPVRRPAAATRAALLGAVTQCEPDTTSPPAMPRPASTSTTPAAALAADAISPILLARPMRGVPPARRQMAWSAQCIADATPAQPKATPPASCPGCRLGSVRKGQRVEGSGCVNQADPNLVIEAAAYLGQILRVGLGDTRIRRLAGATRRSATVWCHVQPWHHRAHAYARQTYNEAASTSRAVESTLQDPTTSIRGKSTSRSRTGQARSHTKAAWAGCRMCARHGREKVSTKNSKLQDFRHTPYAPRCTRRGCCSCSAGVAHAAIGAPQPQHHDLARPRSRTQAPQKLQALAGQCRCAVAV